MVEAIGQPTTHVFPEGYVGTVDHSIEEFEAALRDGPFTWDPVSLYHYSPVGNAADGSWVYRPSRLADRQLHVVLFGRGRERTDVYAHEEYSWLRHPIAHAKEIDIERRPAVRSLRRWLDGEDVAYDHHSRPRRRIRHAVERVQERWSGAIARV